MNPFALAQWIICDSNLHEIKDKAFIYKSDFLASKGETTLYIAAHSQYAVYINGVFVDAGQYDDYEDWQVYDTLDITDFISDGQNELLVWHYVAGEDFSTRSKLVPGIIFSAWIILYLCYYIFSFFSNDKCMLSSGVDCLSTIDNRVLGLCERVNRQLGFTLDFDASATLGDFKPCILAEKEKNLSPRPVKKLITENEVSGKLVDFRDPDAGFHEESLTSTAADGSSASCRTDW